MGYEDGKKLKIFTGNANPKLAKEIAMGEEEGTVIIAEEQTDGRGRLGRAWTSPKGSGIWMSIIIKPKIAQMDASKVTQITAASVYSAISEMGIETNIKWPNDILVNGKKVVGILTELSAEIDCIKYVVVGIGINVNNSGFSEELKSKATSMYIETGKKFYRKEFIKPKFF